MSNTTVRVLWPLTPAKVPKVDAGTMFRATWSPTEPAHLFIATWPSIDAKYGMEPFDAVCLSNDRLGGQYLQSDLTGIQAVKSVSIRVGEML